jgi:hypothetical protein
MIALVIVIKIICILAAFVSVWLASVNTIGNNYEDKVHVGNAIFAAILAAIILFCIL